MPIYDVLIYITLAAILAYCTYRMIKRIRRSKRRRPVPPVSKKFAALCQTTSQQFRLNLMALEAARKMADSAARSSKADENIHISS